VPFVSNLACVLAAAEVVKLLLRAGGVADVPVLDNVLEVDPARDYSRHVQQRRIPTLTSRSATGSSCLHSRPGSPASRSP
jgi:hypothetical protein